MLKAFYKDGGLVGAGLLVGLKFGVHTEVRREIAYPDGDPRSGRIPFDDASMEIRAVGS